MRDTFNLSFSPSKTFCKAVQVCTYLLMVGPCERYSHLLRDTDGEQIVNLIPV